MCENKRLPSLDVWSIESCSWCQNASDSDKECGDGGGDGGGWEGPLSAAPIRRITVTRADVSLAANNTGAEDDVSLCLSSAVRLRASLWQLPGWQLNFRPSRGSVWGCEPLNCIKAPQVCRLSWFPSDCSCVATDVQNWSGAWCCVMLHAEAGDTLSQPGGHTLLPGVDSALWEGLVFPKQASVFFFLSGSCKQRAKCAISPPSDPEGWLNVRNTHGEHVCAIPTATKWEELRLCGAWPADGATSRWLQTHTADPGSAVWNGDL